MFAPAVATWIDRLGSLRDVVRQELVARQLRRHLLTGGQGDLSVLDVGCGQGTQAIELARAGYRVTGVDTSPALLERAHAAATRESVDVRQRLSLELGDLFSFADGSRRRWDVVCCHGVVMYLPSLNEAVAAVVSLATAGGLVSILSRNQAGIAMRAGMMREWCSAVDGFEADHYTNRLGLANVRADRPDAVSDALDDAGASTVAWYGVRLFTDHLPSQEPLPADIDALLAAEDEAGQRDPYRQLASLTHTLAYRRP